MSTEILSECGLFIDMPLGEGGPMQGDWVVTEAGSRYLVLSSRKVKSRQHAQRDRYQMRVGRMAKGCDVPGDVAVFTLAWYSRSRKPR